MLNCVASQERSKEQNIFFLDASLSAYTQKIASNSTDYLLDILLKLIEHNHDYEDHTIAKICLISYDIRLMTDRYGEVLRNLLLVSEGLDMPEIFLEMIPSVD